MGELHVAIGAVPYANSRRRHPERFLGRGAGGQGPQTAPTDHGGPRQPEPLPPRLQAHPVDQATPLNLIGGSQSFHSLTVTEDLAQGVPPISVPPR